MDGDRHSSAASYELVQIRAIKEYEAKEPTVVSRMLDVAMSPAAWLFNQVVPESAIEGALRGANWLAEQTFARDTVLRDYSVDDFDDIKRLPLSRLDTEADEVHNWAVAYATAEGGVAGWFGIFSAPIDIPLIITLALRTVRRIGICYGYHENSEMERDFIFGIMSEAGANNQAQKAAARATPRSLQVQLVKQTWKSITERAATNQFSRESALIAIRELAKQLGVNLTKRKALAAVPAIGALTGAGINALYIGDIGWAARRAYQRRWLADNGRWIDNDLASGGAADAH